MSDLKTLNARILAEPKRSVAMDLLYNEVDDALQAGDFDGVLEWLTTVPEAGFTISLLLGALVVTGASGWSMLAIGDRGPGLFAVQHKAIVEKVYALDPDRADELTRGFK